ncbi:MAG: UDP-glucose 4-epimerase GalE [Quinella sp. 3Q1]|nr:UDP-glucose 4-epimerase GalE [Quinella sp. 3Q1]MBR6888568.1 UDP-glucose 4-epimerase GalE [Selenomonadaceae bacterium]
MAILVCGGAGYIGSHTVRQLLAAGEEVIIADNLSTGHRAAISPAVKFYECDIRDKAALKKIFAENKIEAVFHFAAFIEAGESVKLPLKYFNNNVYGMQILLEAMTECGVDKIIFSSSAAVYGEPERIPIDEGDATFPVNPYGDSKLIMEIMMRRVSAAQGVRYVSLRYFNASGASEDGSIGEDHHPESHLIPLILQVPLGKRDHITVFGTDYPTPDGTCIRDYIHVLDLADAHLCALNYLRGGGESNFFNLGTGHGFSVKEIIDAAEKVTGLKIKKEFGERRPGDPAKLIASGEKARKILGWTPRFDDVEKIIATAWNWHTSHPHGYEEA